MKLKIISLLTSIILLTAVGCAKREKKVKIMPTLPVETEDFWQDDTTLRENESEPWFAEQNPTIIDDFSDFTLPYDQIPEIYPDTDSSLPAEPGSRSESIPTETPDSDIIPPDERQRTIVAMDGSAGLSPPSENPKTPRQINSNSPVSDLESELLGFINAERANFGLAPLNIENSMQFAARIRAEEALTSLSHTRPDSTPYNTAFDESGFSYAGKLHGENLAIITAGGNAIPSDDEIARALFDEWKNSPGHHQNLLGENFVHTGVGIYIENGDNFIRIGSAQLFSGV